MRRPRRQSLTVVPSRVAFEAFRLTGLRISSGRRALSAGRKRWRRHCLPPLSPSMLRVPLAQQGTSESVQVQVEGALGQRHWGPEHWEAGYWEAGYWRPGCWRPGCWDLGCLAPGCWGSVRCAVEPRPDWLRWQVGTQGLPVPDKVCWPALRQVGERMRPDRPCSASGYFRSSDAVAGGDARPQEACRG